ncbi:MAG: lycopene cyclase family protein, partial [Flammeovirgaceae bacterium]|nr:lycopene cyclase family protein [Flammeovirgaceae bacterium]
IEPLPKTSNDRTWCFWTETPTAYENILFRTWKNLSFIGPRFQKNYSLQRYRYQMLRSKDFYQFVRQAISRHPYFHQLQASVTHIEAFEDHVNVWVGEQVYRGNYVFDSRLDIEQLRQQIKRHTLLFQHFKGWFVRTPREVFDENTIQLFDFTIPQENEVRFMYVLPFSSTEALVEFTIFSENVLSDDQYDQVLRKYMTQRFDLTDYQILEEEKGIIPMSDFPFPKHQGERWHFVGTKGGMCKPSTGYAFLRMQRDSQRIVEALVQRRNISAARKSPWHYRYMDALMLDIMKTDGGKVCTIFEVLFRKNGAERMLQFLDEQTTCWQDLKIMASVPPMPFLKAILNVLKKRFGRS